ncbi:hypothetical protein H5410_039616 [Solanum commersonii]|uniref:FAS1 domain-containing protein n=1 Tax=Solanum commersonii TaxID=4109 RepID=A0A9J5XQ38_SOLCO|nr:hypothetical protein H5410_039616 [Solanum commersonii]
MVFKRIFCKTVMEPSVESWGSTSEINSKSTITLLAIPNGAIGDLTSKSNDVVKKILTTHVVLDYYDTMKLQKLKDKTTKLTTMFQESGKASNDQGFLNVTAKDNTFVFGSAVKDAQRDSRLEKSVMNQPYNISILGISQPIVTPGIDSPLAPSSAPPPKANTSKSSPPKVEPPTEEEAEAPTKEDETEAPAPSKDADSPSTDSPPADAQSPSSSSAEKLKISFGFFVLLASMVASY